MDSSSLAVQEQSGSTESNAIIPIGNQMLIDVDPNCVKDAQLNEQFATENGFAPKVRKPYTITKQRERWTEQEHDKFIEALKLYGRAWRKIEEHVGTKTAVQIRSHAQKFFSKVVRESTNTDVSSVKPIEIPPPRPKRKPMHPYPRKMSDPIKIGSSVADHSPMTKSPQYSEQDNCSPTSVFSAICSEMMDTTDSDAPNGSESPVSSDGGVNPSSFSCSGANASPEDTGSPTDEQVPVKLELFTPDNDLPEEEPAEAEAVSVQSLKLFGKTVIVADSRKPSSPTTGTCKSSSNSNTNTHVEPMLPLNLMPSGYSSVNPSMQGPPSAFYCMPLPSETSNAAESISGPPMWAFYGGMQYPLFQMPSPALFPSVPFHNQVPTETNFSGQTSDRSLQKEGSLTGSNNVSVNCETRSCTGNDRVSETTDSLKKRDNPVKIQKGFVPYKRCLAERDSLSSTRTGDEREEQRVRLCL